LRRDGDAAAKQSFCSLDTITAISPSVERRWNTEIAISCRGLCLGLRSVSAIMALLSKYFFRVSYLHIDT
jgi:hypothetical protein